MDRTYITENDAERARLKRLVQQWRDEDLSQPMSAGWTVAGVLAHMAFWDARALYLMNKWDSGTVPSQADWEPDNVDWINDAAKPLCLVLPPRTAAEIAVQLAEETDRRVEALSDELLAQLIAIGPPFSLSRAAHRGEHLDEIEQALSTRR